MKAHMLHSPVAKVNEYLSILFEPGQIFELRAMDCTRGGRPRNHMGYFEATPANLQKAAEQALSLSEHGGARAIYFTLNPLNPDVLARRANRVEVVQSRAYASASDKDVIRRRWLLVDCDPIRPAEVSSTDSEVEQSRLTAGRIRNHLHAQGWPDPLLCHSGNGFHLLYRVDLPAEDNGIVKGCLKALAEQFNSEGVKVDTVNFNPARICKLYGTKTRKGDHTEKRPHRRAVIVKPPGELFGIVPTGQLEALAALAPAEPIRRSNDAPRPRRSNSPTVLDRARNYVARIDGAVSGNGGSSKTYEVACHLVRGFSLPHSAAMDLLLEYNERCQPPWSEQELEHKLSQAEQKADGEPGYLLYESASSFHSDRLIPGAVAAVEFHFGSDEATSPASSQTTFAQPTVLPAVAKLLGEQPAPQVIATIAQPSALAAKITDDEIIFTPHAPRVPEAEAPNDPHRLGRLFLSRFLHLHGYTLSYYKEDWWHWQGGAWNTLERKEVNSLLTACVHDEFERLVEEAKKFVDPSKPPPKVEKVSNSLLSNITNAVESMIMFPSKLSLPCWLPNAPHSLTSRSPYWMVSLENGLIDAKHFVTHDDPAGAFLEPTPLFFAAAALPYKFDPTASCSKWMRFLDSSISSDEGRQLLAEWFGYCLTFSTEFQRFLILEGEGKNGKSVVCAALEALLGEENCSHVSLESFEDRFSLGATLGKLANIVQEIGEVDRVAEGVLKSFTGGGSMGFDRKNKSIINAIPTARLMFSTNVRPRFKDRSSGLWRRMMILPLTRVITESERIFGMDKPGFWHDERPGILNWALEGLRALNANNRFTEPPESVAAVKDYQLESNPERTFLQEYYQQGTGDDYVAKSVVFANYRKWCENNGHHGVMNSGNFGKEVRKTFPDVSSGMRRVAGIQTHIYRGLTERSQAETIDEIPDNAEDAFALFG
jgi:P4 family phage/plasmid primase-like protien